MDPQALDPLFRGAARLGVLLGALELPWEKVAPAVALFSSELRNELELGVDDGPVPLWLRTRGDGQDMTHRVARFMEKRGVAEVALRRLLVTADHYRHQHLLFEVGVDAQGPRSFAWVVRQPVTMDEARAWLAAEGADTDTLARLGLISQALERAKVHALGEQIAADGTVTQLVAFVISPDGTTWSRLELAARRTGQSWEHEAIMPGLTERDARFIVEVQAGAVSGYRLDVDEVAGRTLGDGSFGERVTMLAELSGRQRLHRAVFGSGGRRAAWASTAQPDD